METFFSADPACPASAGLVVGEDRTPVPFGLRFSGVFGGAVVSVLLCSPRRARAAELPALLRRMVELQHKHIVWTFAWHDRGDSIRLISRAYEPLTVLAAPPDTLHQVVSGLAYLHGASVVHGALSISSLVLDGPDHVLIRDCGIACIRDAVYPREERYEQLDANGIMFRAPEQLAETFPEFDAVDGFADSDGFAAAVDIYALGVIASHLWLVHSLPTFSVATIRAICDGRRLEHIDKLPMAVGSLVAACVQCDSRERPSVHDVVTQLKSNPSLFIIQ